ncbi:MAG TPA: cation-transporting P-type ATPase [Candidatus Lokiarchaeia archaeon]|nr:cation-transporting P-type ATPase [Candidatus Lokiarchaeia archaeon]
MPGEKKNKPDLIEISEHCSPIVMQDNKCYFAKIVEDILSEFKVSGENGLSTEDASNQLAKYGQNELPKAKRSIYRIYFAPFLENTIIIVFLIAATLMLVINIAIGRSEVSPTINFFVISLNAIIAIVQQARAQKKLEALKRLMKNVCTVVRNGSKTTIDSEKIVPGDVLDLQEGDRISADARIIVANNFFVNESSITGESMPLNKTPAVLARDQVTGLQDIKNCVFSGTFVTKGNARAVVFSTGLQTEIGRISKNLSQVTSEQEIPLKHKINKFANWLAMFVVVMFVAIWVYAIIITYGYGTLGGTFWIKLDDSIELALKFVPINIVLLSTIILITGVVAMAAKGVIVRKLTAVEALGRASVVCTDKTGTLTKNAMTIQKVWANNRLFDVTGIGYSREGAVLFKGNVVNKDDYKSLKKLVIAGILDNNAEIVEEEFKTTRKDEKIKIERKVIGDPMEGALDVLGEKLRVGEPEMLKQLKFVTEYPFDSELKRMSKIWASTNPKIKHEWMAFIKGATEVILDRCSTIMEESDDPVPLDAREKKKILDEVKEWASKGYRLLGIAWKSLSMLPEGQAYDRDDVETDITFLGFVVIQDPPREGVKEAVRACEKAGVTVVMITGDSKETGEAIGRDLTIYEDGETVVEGKEIPNLDDSTFFKTAVFARVSPDDKQLIVKRYQDHGYTVAMTGDGVNDALALGMADVGLAMGITGTDVAKQAADMIISDDSFNTIELGIHEGRGLFAKLRTMIYFYIFVNIAEAIVLISTSFVNPNFRLFDTGLQINLIYVLPHTFPPLGLTFDRTSLDVMNEKPRNAEEVFSKNVFKMLVINITYMTIVLFILAVPVIMAFLSRPDLINQLNSSTDLNTIKSAQDQLNNVMAKPRTIAFAVIFIAETAVVFSIRRPNIPVWKSFRKDMSPTLIFFVLFTLLGVFVVIYAVPLLLPTLNAAWFWIQPLNLSDWEYVLIMSLPIVAVLEIYKGIIRRKGQFI